VSSNQVSQERLTTIRNERVADFQFINQNPGRVDSKVRINKVSQMKMLNRGLHTDKKSDSYIDVKDSLETNLRDFQKLFKKIRAAAGSK